MSQPDWTDGNVHDPGTPLLQLFDFLQESVLFRSTPESSGRRRRLIGLAVAAAAGLLLWRRTRDDEG